MSPRLVFDMEWIEGQHGSPELAHTTGWLSIRVDGVCATRNEDKWARTVRTSVLVSGYPLALWLAGSWWRLRWETAPTGRPECSWRLSHELPAAGLGYEWPPLTFVSDGEGVDVTAEPTGPDPWSPVTYIGRIKARVGISDFELAARSFVDLIVARLEATGIKESDLQKIWSLVLDEEKDPQTSALRSFEARLGIEPDEGPDNLACTISGLTSRAGRLAAAEIASACAGSSAIARIEHALHLDEQPGPIGTIHLAPARGRIHDPVRSASSTPWDQGRELARQARVELSVATGPLPDHRLAEVLGLMVEDLTATGSVRKGPEGIALAVRTSAPNKLRYLFRKKKREARRFEAARLIGDFLVAPENDHWLPLADSKTARQKLQRAFAAEFLVPIDHLIDFMSNDFSSERMELAADQFQVSPLAIESHLANNNYIPFF